MSSSSSSSTTHTRPYVKERERERKSLAVSLWPCTRSLSARSALLEEAEISSRRAARSNQDVDDEAAVWCVHVVVGISDAGTRLVKRCVLLRVTRRESRSRRGTARVAYTRALERACARAHCRLWVRPPEGRAAAGFTCARIFTYSLLGESQQRGVTASTAAASSSSFLAAPSSARAWERPRQERERGTTSPEKSVGEGERRSEREPPPSPEAPAAAASTGRQAPTPLSPERVEQPVCSAALTAGTVPFLLQQNPFHGSGYTAHVYTHESGGVSVVVAAARSWRG